MKPVRAAAIIAVIAAAIAGCSDDTNGTRDVADVGSTLASSTSLTAGANGPLTTDSLASGSLTTGSLKTAALAVRAPDGTRFDGCVLVADDGEERAVGLMGRTSLEPYDGMAFVFEADTTGQFWMVDTLIPLGIAFVDGTGSLVSTEEMVPCTEATDDDCPRYGAERPYRTAIEVASGQLAPMGLVSGATVSLGAPC